jgi:2',3'-cyclic-nucleotide 2'-phosphodiesterase (5'-nucleotidase family)
MKKWILFFVLSYFPIWADSIKIYYSSSTNGNLLACTCTAIPIAGLSRRVHFLEEKNWKKDKDILIELGDVFSLNDSPVKKKAMLEAYQWMGYSAIFLGKNEITYHNSESWAQWKKFPFVNTNIYKKNLFVNDPVVDPFKILSKGNDKIGIASFGGDSMFQSVSKSISDSYAIQKDMGMIQKMIQNVSVDFWIVGLYGNFKELVDYKKLFPKNTIFLGSGEVCQGQKNGLLVLSGEKIYCSSGKNGDEIGEIEIQSKTGNVIKHQMHILDVDKLKDSPDIQKIADKYQIKS